MNKLFRDYGLGIVLFALFLVSWLFQGYYQWIEFNNEQQEHGQVATAEDYIPAFWASTLENWQSEFLQLFTMVVLTSLLIFKGSSESKDSNEQMQQSLNRIEKALKINN